MLASHLLMCCEETRGDRMKLGEGACLEKVVQFGWSAGQAESATFLVGFQCRSKDFSSAANGGLSYGSKCSNTR